MNYSVTEANCRVDFFKESGKWYDTSEFKWLNCEASLIHDEFIRSLRASIPSGYSGMTAVCLDPYHKNAFPLMVENWDGYKLTE